MGFLYIILSVAGFSLIAIAAKIADINRCRVMPLCALMYAWALLAASLFALHTGHGLQAPGIVYRIAVPFGVSSVIGLLAFQTGIRFGKVSTSWLVINLSAIIPTVGSIVIYREPVSARKVAVLVLVLASMLLLWKDKRVEDARRRREEG